MYKKPAGMKYTDMCIFIDTHVYEDCTDEENTLIFEYLVQIVNMLAHKYKYFNKNAYYEDFALYMATELYLRLKNPKQFKHDENGKPQLARIKSILNYTKKTLYPRKVDFEQKHYSQILSPKKESDDTEYQIDYSFSDKLTETIDGMRLSDFNMYLDDIVKTIKAYLKKIPYRYGTVEWNNIYLSCLLTFLNSITLNNKDMVRIYRLNAEGKLPVGLIDNLFYKESQSPPILYHLPESMSAYIKVLTNEMRHVLYEDLSSLLHTYIPSNMGGMPTLILSEINNIPIEFTAEE